MTQGTRIALVLLVLLVLGTGAYWLGIGLRTTPPTVVDHGDAADGDLPGSPSLSGAAEAPEARTPASRRQDRTGRGSAGSAAGVIPDQPLLASQPGSGLGTERGSGSGLGPGGSRPPGGAGLGALEDEFGPVRRAGDREPPPQEPERSTFLDALAAREIGGKSDDPTIPGFTVVTPVGPEPDPSRPPAGFSPAPGFDRLVEVERGASSERPPQGAESGRSRPSEQPAAPERRAAPAGQQPGERTLAARPAAGNAELFEYVIVEGDTFVTIAEAWLGDRTRWDVIQRANPGVDPTRLRIGQVIALPPRDAAVPATAARDGGTSTRGASGSGAGSGAGSGVGSGVGSGPRGGGGAGERFHVVQSGDTLYGIARSVYNDGTLWRTIYEANRAVIADPSALRPGVRLRIPAR
ncbi:MAG TPA: LysM peptidoglycan-binding domain-containing protein [Phycisphaerales bacterium]|nr:LysM peptidoglycan-binding domain-containing protein [Phycisphaerales bacterium]HMP37449.1 LysM peptidoglycan-binding domain-containing protein [Phycisphaerales bacterium]